MLDLELLITSNHESKDLDYKAPMNWGLMEKKDKCELVKDVLAFANSGGGFIVVGVSEDSAGFKHQGLSEEELSSFETTEFNQFIQIYAEPPINCKFHKTNLSDRSYLVIQIPGFSDTPHVCKQELLPTLNKSYIYIRTDNNNSAPLNSSSDFRLLIERAVRQKQDDLLESFKSILTGTNQTSPNNDSETKFLIELDEARKNADSIFFYQSPLGDIQTTAAYRESWSFPNNFEPDLLDLSVIRRLCKNASENFRGWPYLFYGKRDENAPAAQSHGLSMGHKFFDFNNNRRSDYWQVNFSSLLYQRVMMWEDDHANREKLPNFLEINELACYIAEALKAMTTIYNGTLSPNDTLNIGFKLHGINGKRIEAISNNSIGFSENYTAKTNSIEYKAARSLAEWRAGLEDYAVDIWKYFLERFNWEHPNTNIARNRIQKLFKRES
jgi:hypothetical protein